MAIKLVDVELSQPISVITDLEGYEEVRFLVKLHGLPIGYTGLLVMSARIEPEIVLEKIVTVLGWPIITHLLEDRLLTQPNHNQSDSGFLTISGSALETQSDIIQNLLVNLKYGDQVEPPCIEWRRRQASRFVTVAVCTRDGADRLGPCLDALDILDYPAYEILIVDNASKDDATWKLLEQRGISRYRYVIESRPGISWARNRAIQEAKGDIIAFTDDDARPDRLWLLSLVAALQRPGISFVAGRAYPLELENEAQIHCDKFWGHDLDFARKEYSMRFAGFPKHPYNTNVYGGSYNLAGWREVFQKTGGFDVALGRGSPAGSASDTDLFYRLLRQGYVIAYEPTALVKLVYPSDFKYLVRHVYLGASGIYAFLTKCFIQEPDKRGPLLWYALKTYFAWYLRVYLQQVRSKQKLSRRLLLSSILGAGAGPRNYLRSVKLARTLAARDKPVKTTDQKLVNNGSNEI